MKNNFLIKQILGALVIASLLDFLAFTVCAPYSETTPGDIFDTILEMVAQRGRIFYKLFHHPSLTIVKGAGMVMRAIIEESSREVCILNYTQLNLVFNAI